MLKRATSDMDQRAISSKRRTPSVFKSFCVSASIARIKVKSSDFAATGPVADAGAGAEAGAFAGIGAAAGCCTGAATAAGPDDPAATGMIGRGAATGAATGAADGGTGCAVTAGDVGAVGAGVGVFGLAAGAE